jgi:D-ribulokinase
MSRATIGIDVGTGSARAGLFDRDGRLLATANRDIALWRGAGGVVEHSAADIWRAVAESVREAVGASGLPPAAVAGIGFAATCSLVALGRDLSPLSLSPTGRAERDVIAWMDHRAIEDAARITASGEEALRYFGGSMSPEMQPAKLAWAQRVKGETFGRAAHFLGLTDYLTFRATGSLTRSLCSTVCKFGYLAHEARWPAEFFERIGLDALARDGFARLGREIAAPGTPLARGLTEDAAAALGLDAGTPVGAGLIDAHAGALGTLGARDGAAAADPRRRLALILGTSSSCMALSDAPRFIDGVWGPHLSAILPGRWLIDGGQSAFGAAIDHGLRLHPAFRDPGPAGLAQLEAEILAEAGEPSRAALIAERVHVLPSFIGARGPVADAEALGAIMGLDLGEDRASLRALYVACLCGLSYGVAEIVEALQANGYDFETIVVSGGASRSRLVRQIVADACGLKVSAPSAQEPVLLGSAMIGAAAAGWDGFDGLMASMSSIAHETAPARGAVAAFHAKKRRAYRLLQTAERESRAVMAPRWPELVIFDCDGVLVDSEVIALAVTRRMLGGAGVRLTDEETRRRFLGFRQDAVLDRLAAEKGIRLPDDFPDALTRELLAAFGRELRGVSGVAEAVAALPARVCVASSSGPERLRFTLRVAGYESLFAPNIFSASQVAHGKPSPDLFLFAAGAMGVAPAACLVIEDSVAGVAAACAAGMAVYGFVGGGHFETDAQAADLTAAGADLIFDSMALLPAIVAEGAGTSPERKEWRARRTMTV